MIESTIPTLEQRVRDHINRARKQHALLQKSGDWNQLCSSLDVVGDTELAFDAYSAAPDSDDAGTIYLLVYGVLQALILQQDAVRDLSEVLQVAYEPNPTLLRIREVRNATAGHPTKRRGERRAHFISRISMTKVGFQFLTVLPDHSPAQFEWVDIPALIAEQRKQLATVLAQVVSALDREDAEHKAKFMDRKLAELFPATMNYYFEKIFESIPIGRAPEYARLHVTLIREVIERLKAQLAERGLAGALDSVEYHIGLIEYPLSRLGAYFDAPVEPRMDDRDAYIFARFLQGEIETLRTMAGEIDDDYRLERDA